VIVVGDEVMEIVLKAKNEQVEANTNINLQRNLSEEDSLEAIIKLSHSVPY